MYTRKWRSQPWWPRALLLREAGLVDHHPILDIVNQTYPNLFAPAELSGTFTKKNSVYKDTYQKLLSKLFRTYPLLKMVNLNVYASNSSPLNRTNEIFDFINKQYQYMNEGFTEEKAFEKAEKLFRNRIERKIRDAELLQGVITSNKIRSFMNAREQRIEFEARAKVLRMKRDLDLYSLVTKGEMIDPGVDSYLMSTQPGNSYEKLTVKLFRNKKKNLLPKNLDEELKDDEEASSIEPTQNDINIFKSRVQNLLQYFYKEVYAKDCLQGLSDSQIINKINETPSKIKKATKSLLSQLAKHNIYLNEKGEVDFSECVNQHIRIKYQNNPYVKYALLYKSLDFENPILEHKYAATRQLLDNMKSKTTMKDGENKKLEDFEKTNELNEFESKLGFYWQGNPEKEEKDMMEYYMTLDANPLDQLQIGNYLHTQNYRLFEPIELKVANLEKKWFERRMHGMQKTQSKDLDGMLKNYNQILEKIRRLKLLIDKAVYNETQELLFEEHKELTAEELNFEEIPFEVLNTYFDLPNETKKLSKNDEVEYQRAMKLMKRNELNLELVEPFQYNVDKTLDETHTQTFVKTGKANNNIDSEELLKIYSEENNEDNVKPGFSTMDGIQSFIDYFKSTAEARKEYQKEMAEMKKERREQSRSFLKDNRRKREASANKK